MNEPDLPILGFTDTGHTLIGGLFTAHDSFGYHSDWFAPMFLNAGFRIHIPYFACECLQSGTKDPDMIWPMLEVAHKEARVPFDTGATQDRLKFYLAYEWTALGRPSLAEMARSLLARWRKESEIFNSFISSVHKIQHKHGKYP